MCRWMRRGGGVGEEGGEGRGLGKPTPDPSKEGNATRMGWSLPREYGVRRAVGLLYRELIFLLDGALRRWYRGDSCLT